MWSDVVPERQPGIHIDLLCGFCQLPRSYPWLGPTEESPGDAPGRGSSIPCWLNLGRPPLKLPFCCCQSSWGPCGSAAFQTLSLPLSSCPDQCGHLPLPDTLYAEHNPGHFSGALSTVPTPSSQLA